MKDLEIRKELLSVGIDIGTSTSHLIFSNLILEKDPLSKSEKFIISNRRILYESPIFLTPLKNNMIDYEKLSSIFLQEYEKFGVSPDKINTGAIIITGESARRENAERIAHQLSGEVGKFVVASAGPNLESVLAAKGSGIVKRSKNEDITIMNVDVGGGTSNVAVVKSGDIIATGCINIGGRLIVTDSNQLITRLEPAANKIIESLKLQLKIGEKFQIEDRLRICETMADCLLEFIKRKRYFTDLTSELMQTSPLEFNGQVDELTFSGGIGEYIYHQTDETYDDIGKELAQAIEDRINNWGEVPLVKPLGRPIRATVIGAGQFTLQVSGSTIFLSEDLKFPIRNLPVVPVRVDRSNFTSQTVKESIIRAINMFDLDPNLDSFALSFQDPVKTVYHKLAILSKGIELALPLRAQQEKPFFLIFDTDIGNSVGNVMKRETSIQSILSIDELELGEGDYIDIGEPIINGLIVPVHIKTLTFYSDDDNKGNSGEKN